MKLSALIRGELIRQKPTDVMTVATVATVAVAPAVEQVGVIDEREREIRFKNILNIF